LGYPENFRKAFAALRFLGSLERFRKQTLCSCGDILEFTRKVLRRILSSNSRESTIGIHPLGCIQLPPAAPLTMTLFGFWRLEAPLIKRPHRRREDTPSDLELTIASSKLGLPFLSSFYLAANASTLTKSGSTPSKFNVLSFGG
jgi:hypothetical protein